MGRLRLPKNYVSKHLLIAGTISALVAGMMAPALPESATASVGTSTSKGFDTCAAPSTSTMDIWWTNSPYYWIGIYIGGSSRSCSQSNLTSSWITHVTASGWALLPIWAGLQDPCWTQGSSKFSTDPTTAFNQGENEAVLAVTALHDLGFPTGTSGSTKVALDLETYSHTSVCVAAAQAFVKGWDTSLGFSPSQVSGVYGSSDGSDISALTGSPAPNFIWGADWDNNPDTSILPPIPSAAWSG